MGNSFSTEILWANESPKEQPSDSSAPIETKPTEENESAHDEECDEEEELKVVENDKQDDQEQASINGDELEPNSLYRVLEKRRGCGCCLRGWPRTCALLVGVVIPLLILTFISMGFGAVLAGAEGPGEIESNDYKMENLFYAKVQSETAVDLTMSLPRLCFIYYMEEAHNVTWSEGPILPIGAITDRYGCEGCSAEELVSARAEKILPGANDTVLWDPDSVTVDVEAFFKFMIDCGTRAAESVNDLIGKSAINTAEASDDLSFNWIRCYEGPHSSYYDFRGRQLTVEQRQASGQRDAFSKEWNGDREALFSLYFRRNLLRGDPETDAVRLAIVDSARDATGRDACVYNVPAAAWFWFTVQTTIGYGNQAPSTTEGRAMIYTVGFASIVAFGGVLASSGYILSRLTDDFVKRNGMRIIAKPWCASIFWGCAYYGWMVFIALRTMDWKKDRLGIDMGWRDGYWFSYISTTTVGLGDIFLEPEGLTGYDVVIFPFMFLVGFTFLAAFLGKFAEFFTSILRGNQKSFIDTLLDQHVEWGTHCKSLGCRKRKQDTEEEEAKPLPVYST